jgi:hypothetical protein
LRNFGAVAMEKKGGIKKKLDSSKASTHYGGYSYKVS